MGHIKHLQLLKGSNRQIVMPKCKITVTFHFLALSRALQEFQYFLKIPASFFNFLLHLIQFHIFEFLICCYLHIFCMTSEQIFSYILYRKFPSRYGHLLSNHLPIFDCSFGEVLWNHCLTKTVFHLGDFKFQDIRG